MADERLIFGIKRYWTISQVDAAFQELLGIDWGVIKDKTMIIGKGTDGDNASAQIAVTPENSKEWMGVFKAIIEESENLADGITSSLEGTEHVNFGNRYLTT